MSFHSLKVTVIALVLVALAVPTGAFITDDGAVDDIWQQNGIVVAPADGPNGAYARVNEQGELAVDVSNPGVNADGRTLIRNVFVVANTGETTTRLWLTHDGDTAVTFFESVSSGVIDASSIQRHSLHGVENAHRLEPGERIHVSVLIDTTGRSESGNVLLRTMTLNARTNRSTTTTTSTTTVTPTTTTTTTATPTTTTTSTTTTTTTPTTTTPMPSAEDPVEVDFGSGTTNVSYSSSPVPVDALDEPSNVTTDQPTPVIAASSARQRTERDAATRNKTRDNRSATSTDIVVNEGESLTLTGTRSYIPRVENVVQDRQVAAAREISVPPEYEDESAIVRFQVPKAAFTDTDPRDARIGRRTPKGWQLLDTTVVRETTDAVVLQARTPGFSVFAVFRSPDVTYTWTLPDGTTHRGPNVRTQFDGPGRYNVSLTVRGALGNTATTRHRILVNDEPRVEIETLANASEGAPVTLHANVTNRFGNVTIEWRLPDGSLATGANVTYTASGPHEVTVDVTDEYGASDTATRTFGVGEPTTLEQLSVVIGDRFPLLTWLTLLALTLVAVGALVRRSGVPRPTSFQGDLTAWLFPRRRGPRIESFDVPTWNEERARFEIPRLSVVDPNDELSRVEITVRAVDGRVLARKLVDVSRRNRYTATPERVAGIPATAVDPDTEYVATVHALNRRDDEAVDSRPVVRRSPTPGVGNPSPV